ncbi:MAG TPA: UDP-N-acetylmuramoyl-L-alanine--D-glutamate ligase [Hyphomicrobiales bacterium]|nr:UDP-N-acetylmuramoyl-L-alanine--D-glutamate ligase [Hyphomicrobiales bacterium]
MTPVTAFRGRRVALFGLGGSGLATAKALAAGGAAVVAWDDAAARRDAATGQGIVVGDLASAEWSGFAALVLSPGVPLTHPKPHWTVEKARAAGVEIIGDIELFVRERRAGAPGAPLVAITGTNGKSTTTALIAHILAAAGREVALGGNIGTPILELPPPAPDRVHVIECSSFQIDLAPSLDPTVGVLLNLSEDHLDRHGTMEHYAAIKERLVARADTAIVGVDDALSAAIADRLDAAGVAVRRISAEGPVNGGVFARDTTLIEAADAHQTVVADVAGIRSLRGRHNAQNAAAAVAATLALGLDPAAIAQALPGFPGLPHRMEEVGRDGRVLFVNDSKATNADSAARALASFRGVFWIAGGRPKTGGITSLAAFFPRVAKAYLIGEAAPDFAATLAGAVPAEIAGTLEAALEQAAADALRSAAPEPVVLLSPACASYDQFKNFEERGDRFRALVAQLLARSPQEAVP